MYSALQSFLGGTPGAAAPGGIQRPPAQAVMLDSLGKHGQIEVIEKAQLGEIAINGMLEAVSSQLGVPGGGPSVDLPNKYRITGPGGQEDLFFALETTNFLARQLELSYSLDIFYTGGGQQALAFRLEKGFAAMGAMLTDVQSGKPMGLLDMEHEAWCFPVKDWSKPLGLHEDNWKWLCGGLGCVCCCCCFDTTYYVRSPDMLPQPQFGGPQPQFGGGAPDALLSQGAKPTPLLAARPVRKPLTCPWCDGCCGGGFEYTLERNPPPGNRIPGERVGTLIRRGRGAFASWCCPSHDQDHWILDLSGVGSAHDKLLFMALTLFTDFEERTVDDSGGITEGGDWVGLGAAAAVAGGGSGGGGFFAADGGGMGDFFAADGGGDD